MQILASLLALMLSASQPPAAPDPAQLAIQIAGAREANQAAMRKHSWTTRTEVKLKGETKLVRTETVRYTLDGKLQRTDLNPPQKEKPRGLRRKGGIKGRIKANKVGELKEWAGELHGLLQQYRLTTVGSMADFLNKASFGPATEPGLAKIVGTDVVQAGDELTILVDMSTKELQRTTITTKLDGDTVFVRTQHRRLDSGLSYAARSFVRVPAKEIEMTVERFGFVSN